ncbi:MAG: hypothetical protein EOP48_13225 [Sphingobacteriales bacterium]|nr:MAG: hypothetical protein EOP48_13225 [Sphingobacteriales bacterium]
MSVNLKNYTSTVPASTSMSRIEQYLVKAGASDISKKYGEDRTCRSITFRMVVHDMPVFFQLTAKIEACYKVLYAEVKRPQADTKRKILEQSERTAWKIISDWVEIQISMVMLEQADLIQVFLPFVYNPKTEKTFYDQVKGNDFKMLANG